MTAIKDETTFKSLQERGTTSPVYIVYDIRMDACWLVGPAFRILLEDRVSFPGLPVAAYPLSSLDEKAEI